MKLKNLLVTVILGFATISIQAHESDIEDANWGAKELEQAMQASNVAFLDKYGNALYGNITGFSIERTVQGNTAKTKVNYKNGAGEPVTASFFCHAHGNDIDCH